MTTSTRISNREDILDSRDIQERIDWLESDEDRDTEDQAELDSLLAFEASCPGYVFATSLRRGRSDDWEDGVTLIRDSYFEEYAQELAEETNLSGVMSGDRYVWPLNCIDWKMAARDLQTDYTPYEFDGITYWAR